MKLNSCCDILMMSAQINQLLFRNKDSIRYCDLKKLKRRGKMEMGEMFSGHILANPFQIRSGDDLCF